MANIIASVEDGKLNYNYTDNSKKNGINPTGSTLGYDQFLQLLCAEMQYQDPLEPTSNTDYVAQMATFSQLEATLSLTETQENANASNLVGKQVILKVTSETTGQTSYVDGRVDYVLYENGEVFLSVNDQLYPASALDTVKSMLQLILKFVVIIFIVVAIVIGVVIGSLELGLVINLVMNLVIGAVTFMIYPAMLHEGIS